MAFQGDSIFWVETNKIVANPYQPRREFDEQKLKELSESVRMYGILQPLTVTKKEIQTEDGAFYSEYELIAGERRLRASKLAGLEQVPVIIRSGEDTEQEKLELAIIENLQREDLNAVDRALAFKQLADMFELSHGQVAKKVGRSREYVSNTIRLLLLPDYMLTSLKSNEISEGHARSLLMLKDRPEEQDVVYREILLKKLSVREVERITRKIAADKVRKKNWVNTDPELIEIEREFTDTLGTRVQISKTDFGGKLTIDYFSDEDLQNLLAMMKSQGRMSQSVRTQDDDVSPIMQAAGAAVMAKLSQATPLETVEEKDKQDTESAQVIEDEVVKDIQTASEASSPHKAVPMNEVPKRSSGWSFSFIKPKKQVPQSEPEPSVKQSIASVQSSSAAAPVALNTDEAPHEHVVEADTASHSRVETPQQTTKVYEDSTTEVSVVQPKEGESDDLYSIRNFSL